MPSKSQICKVSLYCVIGNLIKFFLLFQSPDCNEKVQVQRLLLNCPDIGEYKK